QDRDVDPTLAEAGDYRGEWTLPLSISPRPPHAVYFGNQFVWRTTDGGKHWQKISPDLTREDPAVPATPDPDTAADSATAGPPRGPAPRSRGRDRAPAASRRAPVGGEGRGADLALARRRRALGGDHAARADRVVEGRDPRAVARRPGHGLRGGRPSPPRRRRS